MAAGVRRRASLALSAGLCCRRGPAAAHPRRFLLLPAQCGRLGPLPLGSLRPPLPVPAARPYSSDGTGGRRRQQQQKRSVVVVGVPNPLMWLRTRLYFFLIRAYFDQEFSPSEFTQGAKQAFALVSKLISECKYELLEELISKELLQVLKEKLSLLSEDHRSALAADMDEIMYTTAGDIGIYYDDSGRKFVSILMRFWYLTSTDLPDESPDGTKVFRVVFGDETTKETKRLLTANYEFRREFTQGVKPDWLITRIEHPKLLE
ncbi:m-AAA protease-interacting protein 1, mitochondrial-like [Paroedura picta]|uniref:m-AAA protease-interacting protein 1, mitochondrial-like n=1 Tax=Paroedura picta TaxID=143630 RepID=UPI0040565D9C